MTRIPLGALPPHMVEVAIFQEFFKDYATVERVEVETNVYIWSGGQSIEITLKPLMPGVSQALSDEELRTVIFWQMQECLRVLDTLKLKLTAGPNIEIRGEPMDNLGGSTVMVRYEAELSFTVNKPNNWKVPGT